MTPKSEDFEEHLSQALLWLELRRLSHRAFNLVAWCGLWNLKEKKIYK